MQYLLSSEEYQSLISAKKQAEDAIQKDLQWLCTEVANLKPVSVPWYTNGEPMPWGCILTKGGPEYCDECPVRNICPNKWKSWSK